MFQDVKGFVQQKPEVSLCDFLRNLPDFIWQTPVEIANTLPFAGYRNTHASVFAILNKLKYRGDIDWRYINQDSSRVQYKGKSNAKNIP